MLFNLGHIKEACDLKLGFISQVIQKSQILKIDNPNNQIAYNITLKIQQKLGGTTKYMKENCDNNETNFRFFFNS